MFITTENPKSYKINAVLLTEHITKLLIPPHFHKQQNFRTPLIANPRQRLSVIMQGTSEGPDRPKLIHAAIRNLES